jgi:hypothetical protein
MHVCIYTSVAQHLRVLTQLQYVCKLRRRRSHLKAATVKQKHCMSTCVYTTDMAVLCTTDNYGVLVLLSAMCYRMCLGVSSVHTWVIKPGLQ